MTEFQKQIDVLRQMEKAREAIRRKYNTLKLSKLNAKEIMSNTFKPIVEPLEKLVDAAEKRKIKSENLLIPKKKEESDEDEAESIEEYNDSEIYETVKDELPRKQEEDEEILEASGNSENSIAPKTNLASKYISMLNRSEKRSLDTVCGVRIQSKTLKIGDSPIDFEDNLISVGNKQYEQTPGLIELLFKKEPNTSDITKTDESNYAEIVKLTNAHRKYYRNDEEVRVVNTKKFHDYIVNVDKPKRRSKSGTGLLPPPFKIARRHAYTDYIYWDDPNELVSRLRLLVAETSAGNQNHVNEIQSIIEELREAKIIY
nr:TPA_asm: acintoc3 [Megastigmus wasp adintovirus]